MREQHPSDPLTGRRELLTPLQMRFQPCIDVAEEPQGKHDDVGLVHVREQNLQSRKAVTAEMTARSTLHQFSLPAQ